MPHYKTDLDVMAVVIRSNNLGHVVAVHSDIPVRVVTVDGDGSGNEIAVKPIRELPDGLRDAAHEGLNPWCHLTEKQLDKIEKAAAADILSSCRADPGFLAGVVAARVAEMSVEDRLETISDDDDEVANQLGFYPETGDAYRVNRDEGDE